MSQTATTLPLKSGIGTLRWADLLKGLVKSVAGLFVGVLIKTLQDKQLPTYAEIEPILEACVYFIVGYLGINAATNNVGQMFTKNKAVVTVDKEHLENLQAQANEAVG